jgi:hypothetical protein
MTALKVCSQFRTVRPCHKVLDAETSEIWVVDEGMVVKFDGDFDAGPQH